ncbi:hypothetical protein LVB87_07815 [Lysobacter sp. KIS68-7]|uniref:WD40/YVTN/BNR-like repeat-containing protein n=1 Tax=Lysobacter sp. KIS68-7 TaxID=2904252 RepID=UPI001E2AC985|nr:hypothetical protein [Lysobacter sp. KIS68-7]UHQ21024.1 hypothetical protein LVB87_07815 [Lysobacter sp. KIS68-7]
MRRALAATALALAAPVAFAQATVTPQDSGVQVRLRGISAVDANTAWASGREGTVLRTLDGGAHWTNVSVPDAKSLDFRDIEGFDADTAVVLSIGPGEASRVYRTEDGGKTWALTLKNDDERAFFDCMVFEGDKGWMLGDPVDGRYQIRETQDGGRTWALQANGPEALKDEAAFAASGTCIARADHQQVFIAGGGAASRVQWSTPEGWHALDTKMPNRIPAAGIFSMASLGGVVLLVGGDFEHEAVGSAAWVKLAAHGTYVEPLPPPRGYRSGAACFAFQRCIAVGPTGVDALEPAPNARAKWRPLSDTGYDAIDIADGVAWASGDKGRIARITASPGPSPSTPAQAATP